MKDNFSSIGKEVVQTEINALKKLKKSLNKDFDKIVNSIIKCKGKVIFSGVGKSGIISHKIQSTIASLGIPSFYVDAGSCSHGDLGMISSGDVILLISHSGESSELKNIIQYTKRNKNITLIGITSKKNSLLYKSSDISFLLPTITEAGPGNYIPTSSTTSQLALGDALAIATMKHKKFSNMDFKKLHPSGSLGAQLKTVEDIMITGSKIPFVYENIETIKALKILDKKKLGLLIVRNKYKKTVGILVDGQIRRISQKNSDFKSLLVKDVMTKKPITIDKNELAAKALSVMNNKKITSLIVINKKSPQKTIGVIHIHTILQSNIS